MASSEDKEHKLNVNDEITSHNWIFCKGEVYEDLSNKEFNAILAILKSSTFRKHDFENDTTNEEKTKIQTKQTNSNGQTLTLSSFIKSSDAKHLVKDITSFEEIKSTKLLLKSLLNELETCEMTHPLSKIDEIQKFCNSN